MIVDVRFTPADPAKPYGLPNHYTMIVDVRFTPADPAKPAACLIIIPQLCRPENKTCASFGIRSFSARIFLKIAHMF